MSYSDNLYKALAKAETGGEKNPHIRTKVQPKGGSTAFGKVQITDTLAGDYNNRKKLSKRASDFYNKKMKPMYDNFKKHGGNKGKLKDYDPDYDYGGSGKFDVKDEPEYENLAKEILADKAKEHGENDEKIIKAWRGKSKKEDPRYYETVQGELKKYRVQDEMSRQINGK